MPKKQNTDYIQSELRSLEQLCIIQPTRIIMEHELTILIKPCGHKYEKGMSVYCQRYEDGSCEYLGKEYRMKKLREIEKIRYNNEVE